MLQPWLNTLARRRMAVVVATSVLFLSYAHAFDVIMPLWVTKELDFSASDWAGLRSVRFVGTTAGILLLGALADRLGQRRIGSLTVLLSAGVTAAVATGTDLAVWAGMFVLGGLVSTAFVALNTLTQEVSERRRGVANTVYRGVGQATKIVAPGGATWLAATWVGYPAVLHTAAGVLVLAGVVLWAYPGEARPAPFQGWGRELRDMLGVYATAWRNPSLMRLLHINLVLTTLLVGVVGFLAIRLTRELGMSDTAFGITVSVGSLGGLLANIVGALFIDRASVRGYTSITGVVAALAVVVAGLTDSVAVTVAMVLVFETAIAAFAAPSFVWVSREAGPGRIGGALAMHKLLLAIYGMGIMLALGALEPMIGLQALLLALGLAATAAAGAHLALRDPRSSPPRQRSRPPHRRLRPLPPGRPGRGNG